MGSFKTYEVKITTKVVVRGDSLKEAQTMGLTHLQKSDVMANGIPIGLTGHARVLEAGRVTEVSTREC